MTKNENSESFSDALRKMHERRGIGNCLKETSMPLRDSNVIDEFDDEYINDENAEFEFLLQEEEKESLVATQERRR